MKKLDLIIVALHLAGSALCHADYHTNTITTPGGAFAFSVDGSPASDPGPTIDLIAGVTNILIIDTASYHPVVVCNSPSEIDWFSGATPQAVNAQPIIMTTPTSGFPTTLYYLCYFRGFYGEIHITAPASPNAPPNTILEVHVGTNIIMTSTGTNTTWLLVPEFSSNLVNGAWATVPNFTNHFANGINTTTFPRLDPICGPNVFLRINQQHD